MNIQIASLQRIWHWYSLNASFTGEQRHQHAARPPRGAEEQGLRRKKVNLTNFVKSQLLPELGCLGMVWHMALLCKIVPIQSPGYLVFSIVRVGIVRNYSVKCRRR